LFNTGLLPRISFVVSIKKSHIMKLVVFGATGTVGKEVVKQGLEQGHTVTAFCRDCTKLDIQEHPRLVKVRGDVFRYEEVAGAMKRQEVVCVVLGSGKQRNSTVRSEGTLNIIKAMKAHGVQRLICQTTLGAGESRANLNFFWKYIMFGWFLKKVYLDHELQEQYVRDSGLDWTLVRPGAFTNGEKTGVYKQGFGPAEPALKLKISRADVADFHMRQLTSEAYIRKAVGLSY
jgi:putative NADH-flavin reductase